NGLPFARQLAVVVGARNKPEEVDRVVTALAALPASTTSRVIQTNALLGLGDGLKRSRTTLARLAAKPETASAKLINAVLADSARAAADADLSLTARKNAVEILSYGTFSQARPALVPLLDAKQPRELQIVAARSLAGFPDAEVTPTL